MPFVSEPIEPDASSIDSARLAQGEPGVPRAFVWRGQRYEIAGVEKTWKTWRIDRGDRYVDRHWFTVLTKTGDRMRIYCLRSERTNRRWWLFAIEEKGANEPALGEPEVSSQ